MLQKNYIPAKVLTYFLYFVKYKCKVNMEVWQKLRACFMFQVFNCFIWKQKYQQGRALVEVAHIFIRVRSKTVDYSFVILKPLQILCNYTRPIYLLFQLCCLFSYVGKQWRTNSLEGSWIIFTYCTTKVVIWISLVLTDFRSFDFP